MARRIPPDRVERLIAAAIEVFIAHGYRRTQMADVAEALSVAKGTLYRYVESKEALFAMLLRHLAEGFVPTLDALPVPSPEPGWLVGYLAAAMAEESRSPVLDAALERRRVTDAAEELGAILLELWSALDRHRVGMKLLDRCSDHPELGSLVYAGTRVLQLDKLERYLRDRGRRGRLRNVRQPAVVARLLIETVTFWAVHRHWDPHPQTVDEASVQDTVVRFLVEGLTKES